MSYEKFDACDLTLSDMLAVDRTALANERTLLAYLRTTIMLSASAVSLIKVFPANHYAWWTAALLFPVSAVIVGTGLRRYFALLRSLTVIRRKRSAS